MLMVNKCIDTNDWYRLRKICQRRLSYVYDWMNWSNDFRVYIWLEQHPNDRIARQFMSYAMILIVKTRSCSYELNLRNAFDWLIYFKLQYNF